MNGEFMPTYEHGEPMDSPVFHSNYGVFEVWEHTDHSNDRHWSLCWGPRYEDFSPYSPGNPYYCWHFDIDRAPTEGLREAKDYVIALHNLTT